MQSLVATFGLVCYFPNTATESLCYPNAGRVRLAEFLGDFAQHRVIVARQLSNNGGNSQVSQVARLQTPRTSITLPPGLLSPGQAYVFRVRTLYLPGAKVQTMPYVTGPVNGLADVISGIMQP